MPEALTYLRIAAESPTTTDRYIYVYAIALNSVGKPKQALNILEQGHKKFPANTDMLYALVSINKEAGNQERAQYFESRLQKLVP